MKSLWSQFPDNHRRVQGIGEDSSVPVDQYGVYVLADSVPLQRRVANDPFFLSTLNVLAQGGVIVAPSPSRFGTMIFDLTRPEFDTNIRFTGLFTDIAGTERSTVFQSDSNVFNVTQTLNNPVLLTLTKQESVRKLRFVPLHSMPSSLTTGLGYKVTLEVGTEVSNETELNAVLTFTQADGSPLTTEQVDDVIDDFDFLNWEVFGCLEWVE